MYQRTVLVVHSLIVGYTSRRNKCAIDWTKGTFIKMWSDLQLTLSNFIWVVYFITLIIVVRTTYKCFVDETRKKVGQKIRGRKIDPPYQTAWNSMHSLFLLRAIFTLQNCNTWHSQYLIWNIEEMNKRMNFIWSLVLCGRLILLLIFHRGFLTYSRLHRVALNVLYWSTLLERISRLLFISLRNPTRILFLLMTVQENPIMIGNIIDKRFV